MRVKISGILIIFFFGFSFHLKAQSNFSFEIKTEVFPTFHSSLDLLEFNSQSTILLKEPIQPSIFSADKLPLFCKIEHKIAKVSKINFMMRLGSLDYVNKLEGKN